MPREQQDNHVETLNVGGADDTTTTGSTDTTVEDRGDNLNPELTPENLSAVVGGGADNGSADTGGQTGGTGEGGTTSETDPDGDTARPAMIPKARFNEVLDQRRTAERNAQLERERAERLAQELEALRAAKAPAPAPAPAVPDFDVDAKETAYAQALLDGDTASAVKIRREINTHIAEQARAHAQESANNALTADRTAMSLQSVAAQAVKDYPYLNTDAGADAMELIVASRNAKIAAGVDPAKALAEAVAKIAPRFAPAQSAAAPAPNAGTPSKGSTAAPAAQDTRSSAANARGAKDSTLQPPQLDGGVGDRATAGVVNVEAMTEDQFANLSAAEKKRLRGD